MLLVLIGLSLFAARAVLENALAPKAVVGGGLDAPAPKTAGTAADIGEANIVLLSVPGEHAFVEAMEALWQQVADHLHQHQNRHRRLFRGLEHNRVAGRQRRRHFPGQHQQWEIPGDDLPDDTNGPVAR